ATGVLLTAEEWLSDHSRPSLLREYAPLTAKAIHLAACRGDALAIELLAYTGDILGMALADVVAITSPEAFVFFGGLANAGDFLFQPAKASMEANVLPVFQDKVSFLMSALPASDAAILGA